MNSYGSWLLSIGVIGIVVLSVGVGGSGSPVKMPELTTAMVANDDAPWWLIAAVCYGCVMYITAMVLLDSREVGSAVCRALLWPLVLIVALCREVPSILRGK